MMVWISGTANEIINECDGAYDHLLELPAKSRNRGRGSQYQVPASVELADFFEQEALRWSGRGVDPDAKWRIAPCRKAAATIREALGASSDAASSSSSKKLRLKTKLASEQYNKEVCAASRCDTPSAVIYAAKDRKSSPVPLCDAHWEKWCV